MTPEGIHLLSVGCKTLRHRNLGESKHCWLKLRATAEAMVLFKVGVSCYAAVLSDAKLKGFSSSSARDAACCVGG